MLPHPYCRTCGSTIKTKSVCQNCGCDPLKGNSYCCDCGASTMPHAIMCIHCGASFQSKFPAALAILIGGALAVTMALTGYFLTHSKTETSENFNDTASAEKTSVKKSIDSVSAKKFIPVKTNEAFRTITNNIILKPKKNNNDAILRLVRNLIPDKFISAKAKTEVVQKPNVEKLSAEKTPVKNSKDEGVNTTTDNNYEPPARVSANAFSAGELSKYQVGCTYYEGRHKSNIIFFTTNVYGYIKINGNTYPMQGYQKTNDIARFAGTYYDVSIEIEGLAGNENNWVATGILIVKNKQQKTLAVHKIYSSCTEF